MAGADVRVVAALPAVAARRPVPNPGRRRAGPLDRLRAVKHQLQVKRAVSRPAAEPAVEAAAGTQRHLCRPAADGSYTRSAMWLRHLWVSQHGRIGRPAQ